MAKAALKNSTYALLKPEKKLTENQIEQLTDVKAIALKLALMDEIKEAFRDWFQSGNGTDAGFGLLDWMAAAQALYPN